jgi:hypothetical protein
MPSHWQPGSQCARFTFPSRRALFLVSCYRTSSLLSVCVCPRLAAHVDSPEFTAGFLLLITRTACLNCCIPPHRLLVLPNTPSVYLVN